MKKGAKRMDWTTSELAYLRDNAGWLPVEEIARELKRSRRAVYNQAYAHGISLRYYEIRLEWCDECATLRTTTDQQGRCPVCKLREQLRGAEARIAIELSRAPQEVRDMYAGTEALRSSAAVSVPWPDMHGLTVYERRKREEAYRRAVERAECRYLQRQCDGARTRLRRIREKMGTNPRKNRP